MEETIDVARELYLGMLIDGAAGGVTVIASEAGGMDIEEVAETTPERILRVVVDPVLGLQPYQGRRIAYGLNLPAELIRPVAALIGSLYRLFEEKDCALVEINPLVVTTDGRALAVDAKINFDDDALFRHPEVAGLRDPEQEDPLEVEAHGGGRELRQAGRRRRLHGQRRGAGDGDDGRHPRAPERRRPTSSTWAEERTRRRWARAMEIILADPSVSRVLVQPVRRDTALRRGGPGDSDGRGEDAGGYEADGGPNAWDERGGGARHPGRVGPGRDPRRRPWRSGRGDKDGITMSILVDENTRLLVQGITGREGSFHAARCAEYGANLVAGVTPGRGGQSFQGSVPVFNTVEQAVSETGANTSLIFVPPPFAADAIVEAADAGIPTIACITEGIPVMDTVAGGAVPPRQAGHADRAQLPGDDLAGRAVQGGHHAGRDPPGRAHRRSVAQRHSDVRGGRPADRPGDRPVDLRRHRRRPGERDVVL